MAAHNPPLCPFTTEVLVKENGTNGITDALPASYHYCENGQNVVADPTDDIPAFVQRELSLGGLADMKHIWFAGAKRPPKRLHFHIAIGREIAVADLMDLHLIWDNDGRLFVKPLPRFLLEPDFWRAYLRFPDTNTRHETPRNVAVGFLYTYACLVSSEIDFHIANEARLLPRKDDDRTIEWADWKALTRELLKAYELGKRHPRFQHAELRLSRIDAIHLLTRLPPFNPNLRRWRNYGSFFRDNLAWMTAATVFVALVLTAMQVGLATERLQQDSTFQQVSYGFSLFAILGPICVLCLVVLGVLFNVAKDLLRIFGDRAAQAQGTQPGHI